MNDTKDSVYPSVTDAVATAKGAYSKYSKLTLNERQEIPEEVKKVFHPTANELAAMTVSEIDIGNVCDKTQKIKLTIERTLGVEDLITEVSAGNHDMTLYELSPSGIACTVQPCTNPCVTPISDTIGMLATGGAIIHCLHPRAVKVSQFLTIIISETIHSISGVDNLVATLHISLVGFTTEVMSRPDVDLAVCTGGSGSLRQAMTSGKKVVGTGPTNPATIMDATVNFEKAVRDIIRGASFDNNLMCMPEECMVVEEKAAGHFISELLKSGVCYVKNEEEIQKLLDAAVTGNLVINKKLGDRSINEIFEYVGIPYNRTIRLIVAETKRIHPFVTSKLLMFLVPPVRAVDFEGALEVALDVEQSYKHTTTIHSESIEHPNQAAREMQTPVLVKSGSSFIGIGFGREGHTSLTITATTGEGTTIIRHFARRRRYTLASGSLIR